MAQFWGYASGDGTAAAATDPAPVVARPQIAVARAQLVAGQLVASWQEVNGYAVALTRITVSATQADNTTRAYVYVGPVAPENLVSGTRAGAFDENDTNQPIFVPEGTPLNVVWNTAIGTATARLEYLTITS